MLFRSLERALIEVTNKVGVDINRATRNPYYYSLLPYVSGLGPRKASSVVKKINGPIVRSSRCFAGSSTLTRSLRRAGL